MRLAELEACFLKCTPADGRQIYEHEVPFAEADGVWFLCPKCWLANGGAVGTHRVLCWRPRVGQDWSPTPGRWEFEGTGVDDLTLVAGSSSVKLVGGCEAHFYVRKGSIEELT